MSPAIQKGEDRNLQEQLKKEVGVKVKAIKKQLRDKGEKVKETEGNDGK